MRTQRFRPALEHLEDRCTPTVNIVFDGANLSITGDPGNALTITQNAADVSVADQSGSLGTYAVTGNITASLSNSTVARTITLDLNGNSTTGTVSLTTGNSTATTTIDIPDAGTIAGDLRITGGSGVEDLNATAAFDVNGSVNINLGASADSADLFGAGSVIGGNVTLTNVNAVNVADGAIGGFLNINNSADFAIANTYSITPLSVGAGLYLTGGSGADTVTALSGSFGGASTINLGNGANSLASTATFLSGLNLLGGTGIDTFALDGNVLGNVYVNLGHGTSNSVTFGGMILGSSILVYGGNGMDLIAFGTDFFAGGARMSAFLGNAVDTFDAGNLGSFDLARLYVDFGYGADIYLPSAVALAFPVTLVNK